MDAFQLQLSDQKIGFCSLIIDDEMVNLSSSKLEYSGEMHDGLLTLKIHQLYINDIGPGNSPDRRAMLVLPKSRTYCISEIECVLNNEKVDIKIDEIKNAKEIEREARKEGRTTIKSEFSPDDKYFNITLGSLSYNSECDITISMEIISTNIDDHTCQTIIPFSEDKPSSSQNFSFSILFNGIESLSNIDFIFGSSKEKVPYKYDGNCVTIDQKPTEPIVLLTKMKDPIPSIIQNDSNDEYSIISILPHFLNKSLNSDFVFIVDCSGSMGGKPIQKAAECLSIFIHSLPVGCKFNVIKFGSDFESFFGEDGLVEYNEKSLNEANEKVKKLDADMGCTNLFEPLSQAYKYCEKMSEKGNVVQIFLLTDGEIHDNEQVFKLVNKNRSKSRIFSIGIGDYVDKNLVSGLSQISFGKFDFVSDSEKLAEKVVNLLSSSLVPALTNISIHTSSDDDSIEIVPNPIVPLYDGSLTRIYIKRSLNTKPIENVLITGNIGDEEVEFIVDKKSTELESSAKKLFAFNAINDYEKLYDYMHDNLNKSGKLEELKKRIIQLSIENGIISKFTSFIGIEKVSHYTRESLDFSDIRSAFNNIVNSCGFGMAGCGGGSYNRDELRQLVSNNTKPICIVTGKAFQDDFDDNDYDDYDVQTSKASSAKKSSLRKYDSDDNDNEQTCTSNLLIEKSLAGIICSQDFDGKWKEPLLNDFVRMLEIKSENKALENFFTSLNISNDENIKSTIAALCVLNKLFSDERSKWILIEKKAILFLNSKIKKDWEKEISSITSNLN